MTEAELNGGIARLVEIYMSAQHDPRVKVTPEMYAKRDKEEVEARVLTIQIAASTIACLHRIADALESKPLAP